MIKWEFTMLKTGSIFQGSIVQQQLDNMGEAGWELVSVQSTPRSEFDWTFFFKRLREES